MAVVTDKALEDENILRELKESMDDILLFDDVVTAEKAMVNLETFFSEYKNFRNKNPQLYARYQDILTLARWVSLAALNDDKVVRLFHEDLPIILRHGEYDIFNKLDLLLIKQSTLERRDEIRGKLRQAMITSEADLTTAAIKKQESLVAGTVGGWINDYNAFVGAEKKQIDSMKRTTYFVQSPTLPKISENEKILVRRMLDIYEYLKLSSGDLIGFEEKIPIDDEGTEGWVYRGSFQPIDKNIVNEYRALMRSIQEDVQRTASSGEAATGAEQGNIQKEIIAAQQKYQKLLMAVHNEEKQLIKEAEGKTDMLFDILFDENLKASSMKKVGALVACARMTALDELFQDARAALYVESHVLPHILEGKVSTKALQEDFKRKKFSPAYKKELLKALLQDALKKEEDAAMLYQQIVNLAGDKDQADLLGGSFYNVSLHQYSFQASAWRDDGLVNA
ncbi:MAG: hypothetical protein WCV86_03950 [Patescibacteria group bacterium]|jgi:hypothetical protein